MDRVAEEVEVWIWWEKELGCWAFIDAMRPKPYSTARKVVIKGTDYVEFYNVKRHWEITQARMAGLWTMVPA